MARYLLCASLNRLFDEIDAIWPNRDRRTDGWYRAPSTGISLGHNPGHNGLVHAIDVDKDGINPAWIISNIYKGGHVLWYIIWNRTLYSNTYGWNPRAYTGTNPHTDHMHFEVYQETPAENYVAGWGLAGVTQGFGPAPTGATQGFGPASAWDYRPAVSGTADRVQELADSTNDHAVMLRQLRQ